MNFLSLHKSFYLHISMTYREIAYMCLDQLKIASDDSYYTVEHVLFLASKIRSLLLKQNYSKESSNIPQVYYQTICLDLMEVPAISGEPCEGGTYLRSKEKVPSTMSIGSNEIYPVDFYQGTHIAYISRERMRFVGHNRWLQNIIYASKGPDGYLYFKSSNPQFLYLERVKMTAIFEDTDKVVELECDKGDDTCDILDTTFPIEDALVPQLIESIVNILSRSIYKPEDSANNAADDLSEIAAFLRNNVKSNLQKQIEG